MLENPLPASRSISCPSARILIAVAVALLVQNSDAQSRPAGWIADTKTGCRAWNPDPQADETIVWEGNCQDGLAEGRGTLQFKANGQVRATLEGTFHGGKLDGYGVLQRIGGNVYKGNFRNSVADGSGELVTHDGISVGGTWIDGCLRDGKYAASVGRPVTDCPHPDQEK